MQGNRDFSILGDDGRAWGTTVYKFSDHPLTATLITKLLAIFNKRLTFSFGNLY